MDEVVVPQTTQEPDHLGTSVSPPDAAAHSRDASMTGVPWTSSSSTLTSPADRPTRTASGTGAFPARLSRSMVCWIATAAATASDAPAKVAMMPSPRPLTTRPPCVSTASASSRSCRRRRSSAASSPSRARSSVDPTRSVKRTVAVARTRVMVGTGYGPNHRLRRRTVTTTTDGASLS